MGSGQERERVVHTAVCLWRIAGGISVWRPRPRIRLQNGRATDSLEFFPTELQNLDQCQFPQIVSFLQLATWRSGLDQLATIFVSLKGIVWEIYECVSVVLSYLERTFGMILGFSGVKNRQKGGKCIWPKCTRVLARGLVRVPQVETTYQVRYPGKDPVAPLRGPETTLIKHIFPLFGDFWPHWTLKIIPNNSP